MTKDLIKIKVCTECKKEKPITEFGKHIRNKDGLAYKCKDCRAEQQVKYRKKYPNKVKLANKKWREKHSKEYYHRNRDKFTERARRRWKRKKDWIDDIKLKSGCEICGYNKCADALEFHHRRLENKDFNVTANLSSNKKRILEEIKKCMILCANCHRELHYKSRRNESEK